MADLLPRFFDMAPWELERLARSDPREIVYRHCFSRAVQLQGRAALMVRLLLLAIILMQPVKGAAEQFKCYSIFDTATLKVRADTLGWIELEEKPRQQVETLLDSNGDRVWVFTPKTAFTIRPDGTGNLVTVFGDTQVERSPDYYCQSRK
ncbi:hypothetical protein ACMAY6_08315 [Luminiphilus sp. nBUS_16]|uniref:hypothetical protein n=1 Tax=Luminiphilus sp. nBUS_16 TaxID=3395315 RepID=UPI003EBF0E13